MLQVHYARDAWRTNGLRIWIRLVVLSNFHVENNLIELRVKRYDFLKILIISGI